MNGNLNKDNGQISDENKSGTCPFCQKAGEKLLFELSGNIQEYEDTSFEYTRCKSCRTIFIKNPPHDDEVYELNSTHSGKKILKAYSQKKDANIRTAIIEKNLEQGQLLQIECGDAQDLLVLKEHGFHVIGINYSEQNVEAAREKVNEVYAFKFLDFFHYDNEFDGILFINSLNYSSNPADEIEKAINLIKEKGIIVIEEEIFLSSMDKFFGKYYNGYDAPFSKYYFNPLILKKIMRNHGFKLKETKKTYIKYFTNFVKSCSNFLKRKWNIKNAFLRALILSPVFVLSPLINIYFYISNYSKYGVFGDTFLAVFTRSK